MTIRPNATPALDKTQTDAGAPPVAWSFVDDLGVLRVTTDEERADAYADTGTVTPLYPHPTPPRASVVASEDECEQRLLAKMADEDAKALGEHLREIGFQPLAAAASDEPGAVTEAALAFVRAAITSHITHRWWQDSDVQDELHKHGFLEEHTVTERCCEMCECEEEDICYRLTDAGRDIMEAAAPRADATREAGAGAEETFTAWLCEQMPAGTVIGDPKWWAPKILRAVLAFTEAAPVAPCEREKRFVSGRQVLEHYGANPHPDAAARDAARYRFWRDKACNHPSLIARNLASCLYTHEIDETLDALMRDAALRASDGKNSPSRCAICGELTAAVGSTRCQKHTIYGGPSASDGVGGEG